MDNGLREQPAPGEIILVQGRKVHLRHFGKSSKPVIVLECGLSMMSSCWGWLGPGLGEHFRVLAYDRAGLGWSEEREGLRDSQQIAQELAKILQHVEIKEPIVHVGHSMGAMHGRALAKLLGERMRALVFLDGAHPEQMQRVRRIRSRMRTFFFYLEATYFLSQKGLTGRWSEFPLAEMVKALPPKDAAALQVFFRNPTHLRTTTKEARAWEFGATFTQDCVLEEIPLLIITAQKNALPRWDELQKDLLRLSRNSQQTIITEASHLSLLANEKHAGKVVEQIRSFILGSAEH